MARKYLVEGTYIVELAGKFLYYQPDGTVLSRKVPRKRARKKSK